MFGNRSSGLDIHLLRSKLSRFPTISDYPGTWAELGNNEPHSSLVHFQARTRSFYRLLLSDGASDVLLNVLSDGRTVESFLPASYFPQFILHPRLFFSVRQSFDL